MRVDPTTKVLVFSDSLSFPLALKIYNHLKGQAQLAFGIGTNLTNDFGYDTIDMVIKMVRCKGVPVAKFSDSPSKSICLDDSYLEYVKKVFSRDYQ